MLCSDVIMVRMARMVLKIMNINTNTLFILFTFQSSFVTPLSFSLSLSHFNDFTPSNTL